VEQETKLCDFGFIGFRANHAPHSELNLVPLNICWNQCQLAFVRRRRGRSPTPPSAPKIFKLRHLPELSCPRATDKPILWIGNLSFQEEPEEIWSVLIAKQLGRTVTKLNLLLSFAKSASGPGNLFRVVQTLFRRRCLQQIDAGEWVSTCQNLHSVVLLFRCTGIGIPKINMQNWKSETLKEADRNERVSIYAQRQTPARKCSFPVAKSRCRSSLRGGRVPKRLCCC
jgi:hypothetical protein